MFRGVSPINMDAKGRLAIPSRYRDALNELSAGRLVANIHLRKPCLVLYPLPVWDDLQAELQELSTLKPETGSLKRMMLAYASDLEMDANGRILIQAELREHAQLAKKIVLAGQGRNLEIWSEQLWQAECEAAFEQAKSMPLPEELFEIGF